MPRQPLPKRSVKNMPKVRGIVLVIALLLFSQCSSRADKPIRFGIGVGVNLGTFTLANNHWPADSALYQSPHRGLIIDAFSQARISEYTFVEPHLMYIQKGTKLDNISFNIYSNGEYGYIPRGSIQVEAEFIELSTVFTSRVVPDGIRICTNIGPLIGIILSSQTRCEFLSRSSPYQTVIVQKEQWTTPIEPGVELGMTLDVSASDKVFCLLNWKYRHSVIPTVHALLAC
jgi:hypothetical protein